MQWLTALLAFATTMFVFAVIVSMLVEMIHRIWDLRSKGMKLMLKNLYSRVIEPKLIGPSGARPPTADEFASMMMENRAVMAKGETSRGFFNWFKRCFVDRAVVTDIPVAVFMQKLVHDRVLGTEGTASNKVLKDENVLKDIAQKYEAFGQEVSICFESRARLLSVFVAFVVAFMFYVHPYRLAVTYINNPQVAQGVADKAADVKAEYAVLVERLNAAATGREKEGLEGTEDLKKAIASLQNELKAVENQTKELRKLAVSLGWPEQSELKSCDRGSLGVANCLLPILGSNWTFPSVANIFWLLVGGLLVGLGAPFWAKAVSSLTTSSDLTQRIAEIVTPERTAAAVAPAAAQPADSTPMASFKVARAAAMKNMRP